MNRALIARWLTLVAVAWACGSPCAAVPGSSATEASQQEEASPDTGSGEEESSVQPPDGVWLQDEDGRRYFIDKYPRIEGRYKWIEEGKIVRVRHMMPLELESYDEQYFYFRVYDVPLRPPVDEAETGGGDSEENEPFKGPELKVDLQDEVDFVDFGEGLPLQGQWRQGLVVVDFDEDGELDLVAAPTRKGVQRPSVFKGNGRGQWEEMALALPDRVLDYGDIAVADLDGRGGLDLVVASHRLGITAMVANEEGGFDLWSEGLPWLSRTAGSLTSRALVVLDWNGDDRPDLVALSEGMTSLGRLQTGEKPELGKWVFVNRGDGSWEQRRLDEEDESFGDLLMVHDVNGDGELDLVSDARRLGDRGLVHLRTTEGLETVEIEELPQGIYALAVAVGDLDGDGHADLAVSHRRRRDDAVTVLWGDGSGRQWRPQTLVTRGDVTGFSALGMGDFDGDGRGDLVAVSSDGSVWPFFGLGERRFELERSPELEPEPEHSYCSGIRVLSPDLDRDGADELVVSFAGEPGGEALLQAAPRCSARGALRVWKARERDREPGPGGS